MWGGDDWASTLFAGLWESYTIHGAIEANKSMTYSTFLLWVLRALLILQEKASSDEATLPTPNMTVSNTRSVRDMRNLRGIPHREHLLRELSPFFPKTFRLSQVKEHTGIIWWVSRWPYIMRAAMLVSHITPPFSEIFRNYMVD
jgi:hypothetical protein